MVYIWCVLTRWAWFSPDGLHSASCKQKCQHVSTYFKWKKKKKYRKKFRIYHHNTQRNEERGFARHSYVFGIHWTDVSPGFNCIAPLLAPRLLYILAATGYLNKKTTLTKKNSDFTTLLRVDFVSVLYQDVPFPRIRDGYPFMITSNSTRRVAHGFFGPLTCVCQREATMIIAPAIIM